MTVHPLAQRVSYICNLGGYALSRNQTQPFWTGLSARLSPLRAATSASANSDNGSRIDSADFPMAATTMRRAFPVQS